MDAYTSFLTSKSHAAPNAGFVAPCDLPPALKPFQRDIVQWALRMGRAAIFAGTGLGRRAIGAELKESYFRQAVKNLRAAEGEGAQAGLFDDFPAAAIGAIAAE